MTAEHLLIEAHLDFEIFADFDGLQLMKVECNIFRDIVSGRKSDCAFMYACELCIDIYMNI